MARASALLFVVLFLILPMFSASLQLSLPVNALPPHVPGEEFLSSICARVVDAALAQYNSLPHANHEGVRVLQTQLGEGCRGIIVCSEDIRVEDEDYGNKLRIAMDNGNCNPLRDELAKQFHITLF